MFLIESLYANYREQTKEMLISRLRDELAGNLGSGYDTFFKEIEKCIELAEEYTNKHSNSPDAPRNEKNEVIRRSGEPYILHPLRVCLILVHEKVYNKEALKAAILHDLLEDTTYSYADMEKEFGEEVVQYVHCVTNVSKEEKKALQGEGLTSEELDYAGIIDKIRSSGKLMALFIKFADRLDNLMTLDAMPLEKQLNKIQDTQQYIVPLVERLHATRFLNYIEEAIFKIQDKTKYELICDRLVQLNADLSAERVVRNLLADLKGHFYDVQFVKPTAYEISKRLPDERHCANFALTDVLYELFLISSSPLLTLTSVLDEFATCGYAIDSVDPETESFYFVCLTGHRFHVQIMTSHDYNIQRYGASDIELPIVYPSTVRETLSKSPKITVCSPGGDSYQLDVGATAIDFALEIHSETLHHMVGARVNGKNCEVSRELRPNCTVEIITDVNKEIPLPWILYCQNKKTRAAIYQFYKDRIYKYIMPNDNKK